MTDHAFDALFGLTASTLGAVVVLHIATTISLCVVLNGMRKEMARLNTELAGIKSLLPTDRAS